MLRKVTGQGGMKLQDTGENCIMRSVLICTSHQMLLM